MTGSVHQRPGVGAAASLNPVETNSDFDPAFLLQHGAKFREGMGNGLRLRINPERRRQTQNKKRKSHYEKSKHSVQTNSRTSDPAAPRLLCGNVYLGTHSGSSQREVPFNATLSGYVETSEFLPPCTIHGHAIVFGNATHLGVYTGTGELYQDVCNPMLHTLAAFTGLRPTATNSPALSRGT